MVCAARSVRTQAGVGSAATAEAKSRLLSSVKEAGCAALDDTAQAKSTTVSRGALLRTTDSKSKVSADRAVPVFCRRSVIAPGEKSSPVGCTTRAMFPPPVSTP